jgi:hypothetical protein
MLAVIIVIRDAGAININTALKYGLLTGKQIRIANQLGDERTP